MKPKSQVTQANADAEVPLQITVPKVTKVSLRRSSADTGDPMRLIVLRALANAGIQVPEEELFDRRKSK